MKKLEKVLGEVSELIPGKETAAGVAAREVLAAVSRLGKDAEKLSAMKDIRGTDFLGIYTEANLVVHRLKNYI